MNKTSTTILRIDASMRKQNSVSRNLADMVVKKILANTSDAEVISRDLKSGVGFANQAWREASLGRPAQRSTEDRVLLAQSDALSSELDRADILVLAVPIYNFSIPAILKAWIDMVCRSNIDGLQATNQAIRPQEKRAVVILTSSYTMTGAPDDFTSNYLNFILPFIGVGQITMINATGLATDKQAVLAAAHDQIENITALMPFGDIKSGIAIPGDNISAAAE